MRTRKREVKLNVGDDSPGKDKAVIYVTSSDRKEVMAVKKTELDSVKKSLAEFRSRDLLSPAAGDIQAFTLSESSKDKVIKGPIEMKKGGEERWSYIQPPYGDAQATGADPAANDKAPTNVQSVTSDISNLKVESDKDFVADDVTDLGKYHLDPAKDDIVRIEIERVEEIAKDAEGNKEKKTAKVALLVGVGKKVDDKSDQYYAYLDDPQHKDIVKVSAKSVARFILLLDHKDALRDRNLVALGNFRKPDALDIKNSYGLLEFRRTSDTQKPWKLWRGDKSYTVDEPSVQALITALTAPNQVESFPEPSMKAQLGLDKPDVTVTIWADSLPAEEKKKDDKKDEKKATKPEPKDKDKPAFTLSFGFRKENSVAVERKREDEKTSTDRAGAGQGARPGARGTAGLSRQGTAVVQRDALRGGGQRHEAGADARRRDLRDQPRGQGRARRGRSISRRTSPAAPPTAPPSRTYCAISTLCGPSRSSRTRSPPTPSWPSGA